MKTMLSIIIRSVGLLYGINSLTVKPKSPVSIPDKRWTGYWQSLPEFEGYHKKLYPLFKATDVMSQAKQKYDIPGMDLAIPLSAKESKRAHLAQQALLQLSNSYWTKTPSKAKKYIGTKEIIIRRDADLALFPNTVASLEPPPNSFPSMIETFLKCGS